MSQLIPWAWFINLCLSLNSEVKTSDSATLTDMSIYSWSTEAMEILTDIMFWLHSARIYLWVNWLNDVNKMVRPLESIIAHQIYPWPKMIFTYKITWWF